MDTPPPTADVAGETEQGNTPSCMGWRKVAPRSVSRQIFSRCVTHGDVNWTGGVLCSLVLCSLCSLDSAPVRGVSRSHFRGSARLTRFYDGTRGERRPLPP